MKVNFWYFGSLIVSLTVIIPILTVFSSFFENTTNYFEILKNTFLVEYIFNSLFLLIGVLFMSLTGTKVWGEGPGNGGGEPTES